MDVAENSAESSARRYREARVITERFLRPDHRPPLARLAACLPLVLGGTTVGWKESHAAIDAERPLTPVRERELRILSEAEDMAMRVDDHRVPLRRACVEERILRPHQTAHSDRGIRPRGSETFEPPKWPRSPYGRSCSSATVFGPTG